MPLLSRFALFPRLRFFGLLSLLLVLNVAGFAFLRHELLTGPASSSGANVSPSPSIPERAVVSPAPAEPASNGAPAIAPEPFVFLKASAHTWQSGDPVIQLRFSDAISTRTSLTSLRVEPDVGRQTASISYRTISIRGEFEPGRTYRVRIPESIQRKADGRTLRRALERTVTIPNRPANARLLTRRGRLTPSGQRRIDLGVTNTDRVDVRARRVHESNLVPFLTGELDVDAAARTVLRRTYPVTVAPNQEETVAIALEGLLGEEVRGLFQVAVREHDPDTDWPRWQGDEASVLITDVALACHRGVDSLLVLAASHETAEPIAGARIEVRGPTNQVLAEGVTDPDGTVRLALAPNHPDGPPTAVIARSGEDLSYLELGRRAHAVEGVDLTGRRHPLGYDVMVYAERSVYRPGDPVHATAVVRELTGELPGAFPLEAILLGPGGRVLARTPLEPAPAGEGVMHATLPTRADAPTGPTRLRVTLPGAGPSESPLAEAIVHLEAFLPVRLEVQAKASKERYVPGESPNVAVHARHLTGGEAEGLALKVSTRLQEIPFAAPGLDPRYQFTLRESMAALQADPIETTLDGAGRAESRPELPDAARGVYRASFEVSVTEPGGRTVSQTASALVDRVGRHLGAWVDAGSRAVPGHPATVRWLTVDGHGAPIQARALTLKVLRVDREVRYEEQSGRMLWRTIENEVQTASHKIQRGQTQVTVRFPTVGRYRIQLWENESSRVTQIEQQVTQPGTLSARSPDPDQVSLAGPARQPAPGDIVSLQARVPFPGLLLVTLESNRVLWHQSTVVDATKDPLTIEVPVPAAARGSVFVRATLLGRVRTAEAGDRFTPPRALGLLRLDLDHEEHRLAVRLGAPAQARPGTEISLTLSTASGPSTTSPPRGPWRAPSLFPWRTRSVHVWAVDRGIVLAGGGNAPDPFSHFYGRRAHQVTGEDSALDLLPDVRRLAGTQTIGGDSGEPELDALYRNPVPTEHASSAIVWRRALALPAEASEIAIPLEVPRFSGTLEFFAVVIEGDRYGSATARTEVTSPLILEASWPRFAAPGDRFTVPVRLVNRTGSKATIAIEAVTSGPVTLELDASPRTLAAGEALTLRVPAKAGGLGAVTVDLRARPLLHGKWGAHLGQTRGAFRVRPALGLTTRTRTLSLTAGEPLELDLSEGFVPSSVRAALTIGGDPNLDLAPLVGGLLDYPYGCLEQTSSRMLALLCAPELARLRDPDAEDRNAFARAALALGFRRLSTMQTSRGGLSYWPGGSECHVFGSIWTALRIADAERHAIGGIPGGLRPGLVRYLREVLARPTNDTERDPNTRAQICHALAALGVPERGFAEHLRERPQDLDLEGLSSLAAAYHLTAEPEPAARLLELAAKHVAGARFVSEPGGPRLTSRARQLGAFLAVLAQVDPASPLAAQTAERLLGARKGARFSNTLENATALLGLSRLAAARGPRALQTFRGTLAVGPEGRAHRFSHEAPLHVELEGERVSITLSGEGTAYLALTVRGVPLEEAGAHEPTDRGLRVRRRFLDAEGVERSLTEVRGGELLTVELELNAPGLNAWDRRGEIVILDLLPGGFEIENPRLATSVGRLDTGAAERTELLSDRAIFFTSAGPEVSTYRYTIRAVTEGDFAVPPPHASSMYDPGLTSVGGFDAQRRAQVRR